jgi:hypothetical protein
VQVEDCQCTANTAGTSSDLKFSFTHLMTAQRCLTSAIVRRSALTAGPLSSSSLNLSLSKHEFLAGFHGSTVMLLVPKLFYVCILWCSFDITIYVNEQYEEQGKWCFLVHNVESFIAVFATSSVSAKTIASKDLRTNAPKTSRNKKK